MTNKYLFIDGVNINYADSAFSGVGTVEDKNKFFNEKADEWLNSKLGNYLEFSKRHRKEIAKRWKNAANLADGKYNYYFNLEDKSKVFEKEVKELADIYEINYKLIIIGE